MVTINPDICNGCGDCVRECPNNAIFLQNNHAFIDQERCQECEICLDFCPRGAILTGEPALIRNEVIRIPSVAPVETHVEQQLQPRHTPLRDSILPALGAALLWTGRELVPRVADLALGYLDRRIQSTPSTPAQKVMRPSSRQVSRPARGGGSGRRRRRRRRNS